jgi:excisionase family DNA binding protein
MIDSLAFSSQASLLLWSDRQVAMAIGMSRKTVQALARAGSLPAFKIGRFWRFDPSAIQDWIHQQKPLPAAGIGVKTQ